MELILLKFQEENITSNSDSEPRKEGRRPSFNRSKSLDHQVQPKLSRQESAETDGGYGRGERTARHNGQPYRSAGKNFHFIILTREKVGIVFIHHRNYRLVSMVKIISLKSRCIG